MKRSFNIKDGCFLDRKLYLYYWVLIEFYKKAVISVAVNFYFSVGAKAPFCLAGQTLLKQQTPIHQLVWKGCLYIHSPARTRQSVPSISSYNHLSTSLELRLIFSIFIQYTVFHVYLFTSTSVWEALLLACVNVTEAGWFVLSLITNQSRTDYFQGQLYMFQQPFVPAVL